MRVVKMVPETGQLDWDDLRRQLSRRTKLLAIGAASNALGTINDVAAAARMAHAAGALLFVDAVHYAPHQLVDVREMDCDFLGCSAYKFYGPHVGVLYGKHDLLDALDLPKLRAGARFRARARRDRHAEPRGDRGRGARRSIFSPLSRPVPVPRDANGLRPRSPRWTSAATSSLGNSGTAWTRSRA